MTGSDQQIAWLSDARLAAHAMSAPPAWLWSADASRILWANPSGAAIFAATSAQAAAGLQFDVGDAAVTQVARLAGTLPPGGVARLERLHGFGATRGGVLLCLAARINFADGGDGILLTATEPAGDELMLPERARRILSDFDVPAALFTADGEFVDAKPEGKTLLANRRDLVALGAEKLAREATLNGRAEGHIAAGRVLLLKLGDAEKFHLLMLFPRPGWVAPLSPLQQETALGAALPAAAPEHAPPLRFVWEMDASGRFTQGVEAFAQLLGPNTAARLDRPWNEIAAALELDSAGAITAALAAQETWSGIVLHWPVDEGGERLAIELSGLPVFDRDRRFVGFRGFGICRDMQRLAEIERLRATPPKREELAKVLPFPGPPVAPPDEPAPELPPPQPSEPAPTLSPGEHSAFQELARELNERLKRGRSRTGAPDIVSEPAPPPEPPRGARSSDAQQARPILDRLPIGILVYRLNSLLYANRAFLDWTGYPSLDALSDAGGLDSLFIETKDATEAAGKNGGKSLTISTSNGKQKSVEGRLFSITWNNENALVLMISTQDSGKREARTDEAALGRVEKENAELKAILDTATDGVLVLDRAGRVLSANRSARALFGYDGAAICELSLADLLTPESRRSVLDYLERLARNGGSFDCGREVMGRVRQGGLVPLHLTMGPIEDGEKLCAVLRDVTAWKRSEEELTDARRDAERTSTAKSEFLAKISHAIRTGLNAILGFSEVMLQERFGALGNERYRQYIGDIRTSGGQLIALVDDLIELSRIEAGKLDLSFVTVDLNELVQQCVAALQPEANRQRVIIRTSLPEQLPPVVADARSVRQIALNLISSSIKFSGAGGQVIVSTGVTDEQEVVLHVRDTGAGMSEKELETTLEPFRQIATSANWGVSGTGLGLPITKALAEANRARFRISSRGAEGTLVEIAFPATRVLAQ